MIDGNRFGHSVGSRVWNDVSLTTSAYLYASLSKSIKDNKVRPRFSDIHVRGLVREPL